MTLLDKVSDVHVLYATNHIKSTDTPAGFGNILLWRFDHEIFSMVIPSLLLIQEGQLVSGKRMCTVLVDRLDY